jgi:uncharacterized RDD family membrane protein YckC
MTELGAAKAQALQAPSLRRRMASFVYEALLLFGIGLIPGVIGAVFTAMTNHQHPLQSEAALRIITFVLYGLYFTWFWSARGQTLPMQTWHIRVVNARGERPGQVQALMRYLASCLWVAPAAILASINGWSRWEALAAMGVGIVAYAMLALLRPDRQFWHDALCGTRLIDARPSPKPAD